jgi:hypothetical protein
MSQVQLKSFGVFLDPSYFLPFLFSLLEYMLQALLANHLSCV